MISQKNNHPKITNMNRNKTCFYFTCCDLIIKGQELPKCYFQSQFSMSSNDFHFKKIDQGINFITVTSIFDTLFSKNRPYICRLLGKLAQVQSKNLFDYLHSNF